MLHVRYRGDGKYHSLVMVGHAGYDESGKDIVCAGASAIVYALLGWLENNEEELEDVNTNVEPGETWISCEGGEKAAAAFEMACIGLEQIADFYPDHVEYDSAEVVG